MRRRFYAVLMRVSGMSKEKFAILVCMKNGQGPLEDDRVISFSHSSCTYRGHFEPRIWCTGLSRDSGGAKFSLGPVSDF
jgi:hypothetical protein